MVENEIKFTVSHTTSKLTGKTGCYQGQIVHNRVLDEESTREAFAAFTQQRRAMADLAIDNVGAFIAEQIALGNHIDLGVFQAGVRMRGSLPAMNAPFDPRENALSLELTPGKSLKRALRALKPTNAVCCTPIRLVSVEQVEPENWPEAFAATGPRTLMAFGDNIAIDASQSDEGVWIETDAHVRLLQGEILESDASLCRLRLIGDIAPSLYWFVLVGRSKGLLRRVTRRITAR